MMNIGWRHASALTLAALVGLSGTAAAQKPNKQKPHQVRQTDAEPTAPATAEEAAGDALLEQMTSQVSDDLLAIGHPDGTISMDLQGRFMSVMIVKTNKDGSQAVSCETGEDALAHALGKKTPADRTTNSQASVVPVLTRTAVREIK